MVVDGGRKSPWRNELSPCAVGIMDALDEPFIREVYVQAAPQTVKTQSILNYLLKRIDQVPTSAMLVMPDEKLTRRIFRRRLIPSIKDTPRISVLLSPVMGDVTRTSVAFINGMDITGAWAGSPAAMASDAMEIVVLDEVNKYPAPQGDEPNAFDAARQRTNSFPFTYKIYTSSTPTNEHGMITQIIKKRADEVRHYYVKCPICGEEQRMVWDNISWGDTRDPRKVIREKLARYNCRACGMQWDDSMRDRAVLATMHTGWRADEPISRPRAVAFKLPSWYALSMSEAVAAFLEGQDDPDKLKTWVTQHCAEEWLEKAVKKTENAVLQRQSIYPALIVPPDVVALTCGIDVQKRGFWFVVRGWAEDLTSWLIQYGSLTSWTDVETLIYQTEYQVFESPDTMKIWRAGIDTGGGETDDSDWSRTEEIYQWLRKQPMGAAQRVFGTKGATHIRSLAAKRIKLSRIDTLPGSQKPIPGGLELRLLDTSQYKGLIHFRLGRKEATEDAAAETQRFYVHQGVGIDYVKQLLAEEYRMGKGKKYEWKQTYYQNHLLDCEVMAAACADAEWLPSLQMMAAYMKQHKDGSLSQAGKRRVISSGVN
jgi:phage terminase large subunit GpA-like protein